MEASGVGEGSKRGRCQPVNGTSSPPPSAKEARTGACDQPGSWAALGTYVPCVQPGALIPQPAGQQHSQTGCNDAAWALDPTAQTAAAAAMVTLAQSAAITAAGAAALATSAAAQAAAIAAAAAGTAPSQPSFGHQLPSSSMMASQPPHLATAHNAAGARGSDHFDLLHVYGLNASTYMAANSTVSMSSMDASSSSSSSSREATWCPPAQSHVSYSDRFIPSRAATQQLGISALEFAAACSEGTTAGSKGLNPTYNLLLRSALLGPARTEHAVPGNTATLQNPRDLGILSDRLLKFQSGPASSMMDGLSPAAASLSSTPAAAGLLGGLPRSAALSAPRFIAKHPFKVLDAPLLPDDFYLNLVDWSSQNVLAIGLGGCVWLWSASTSTTTKLCDLSHRGNVCSVAWSKLGGHLSIGTSWGDVQVWDIAKLTCLRVMSGHRARVGVAAWSSHMLSTGSRDGNVLQRDVRVAEPFVMKLVGHRSEVCGLRWSPDDRQLASGGNDNALYIWESGMHNPSVKFTEHTAAVKAIAWSPHQHGLLASAGGTADRCIRFWNTRSNSLVNCVDTGSQVCNLAWSKNTNELVSTHGYSLTRDEDNQIIVWKYPSMTRIATMGGHVCKVLYLTISPDGQTVATGAADETLRFWRVFPTAKEQEGASVTTMIRTQIR